MKNSLLIQIAILLIFLASGCNQQNQNDMETKEKNKAIKTTTVISKDGTEIAYEKTNTGPPIIVVNGALSQRKFPGAEKLAELLAKDFTVIFYDRRGRGESTDTKPYAVEREIEDLAAVIDEVGGNVYLFGSSSGAALALLAAEKLGPGKVTKLALYEPPYGSDSKEEYEKEKNRVNELIKNGKPGDAVAFFMERRGTPPDKMEEMKKTPQWQGMVGIGHTLAYDFEVMGDGAIPVTVAKNISVPTLVIDGEKSFDFVHATADSLGKIIPRSVRKTIKGQSHNASPESLAPVLTEFFGEQK
jgi:pimeloyl-ACP methyl ester carboxylesterase